jgi:L-rhamnose isomerase/sugar isomerase
MTDFTIAPDLVASENESSKADLSLRITRSLGEQLSTAATSTSTLIKATRSPPYGRRRSPPGASAPAAPALPASPADGEPRDIFDKIEDCAVIQQLTQARRQPSRCISPGTRLPTPQRLKERRQRVSASASTR